MPTHLSVLTGIILWTEEPGGLQSTGLQSQTRLNYINYINTEIHTHTHTHTHTHKTLAWHEPNRTNLKPFK